MKTPDFETFLSPYTWRYGSQPMRQLWSEIHKRRLWRRIWVALARVESEYGLVALEQVLDLEGHQDDIDLEQAFALEKEIQHDLMAEVKTFAAQCPKGGGIIHLGATSMDIEDNADALRIRAALAIVLERLRELLASLAEQIERWAETPMIAFTHLQPAEPSTVGYRLAFTGQDLLENYLALKEQSEQVRGKGFKGAVGTSATYADLVPPHQLVEFETRLSHLLDLPFFPVTHQTYPRSQDFRVTSALAGLGATLSKFAFDLRILQSPPIGEWAEPFGKNQIGSSAMPFKRNPIHAEKINSLARSLAQLPRIAWDNAANSLLERTLDDSANRRVLLPEAFLITDELLLTATKLVQGLIVDEYALARNLSVYGTFAATEKILMETAKAGADRQEMHAHLRNLALVAWESIRRGESNPLADTLLADPILQRYLSAAEIESLLKPEGHLGLAPQRAHALAAAIQNAIALPAGQTSPHPVK